MEAETENPRSLESQQNIKCTLCGICKFSCPAYKLYFDEAVAPRGKAMMLKKEFPSKYLYLCTLCKACEAACILKDIDIVEKVRQFRKELIEVGITTEPNKRMISNIRKHGNVFGMLEPGKKIELFCC